MSEMLFYPIAIVLGIGLLVCIFINPFIGLYAFTVFLYLKPGIFHPALAEVHLVRIIGVMTFIILFLQSKKHGKIKFFVANQSTLLIWFVAMMCLSIFTSIWRSNTVGFLVNFIKVVIAYFLIINLVRDMKQLRALIWAMILSALYIGIGSIQEYYGSGAFYLGDRMFGAFSGALFGDPNDLAMCFIMLIPFLYFDLFRPGGVLRKIFQFIIIAVFCWGIVLTQSRGGFLGMSVMLFTLWTRSRRKILLAVGVVIAVVVCWHLAPEAYKIRVMGIQTALQADAAAISRVDAWKAGWGMMTHRLFGAGVGNFGEAFVHYRPLNAVDVPGMRRVAHNMFIQVGGESGFSGLFIFIVLLGSTFRSLLRIRKKSGSRKSVPQTVPLSKEEKEISLISDAIFVSLVGYCASGMFLSQGYNFILYYLIAFSVVLGKLSGDVSDKQIPKGSTGKGRRKRRIK